MERAGDRPARHGSAWWVSSAGWAQGGVDLAPLTWPSHPLPWQRTLYELTADHSAVLAYDGTTWTRIGGPAAVLHAGGAGLFATNPQTGDIYRYNNAPMSGTRVGGPGRTFAVNDDGRYGLSPDGGVFRWTGQNTTWQRIGEPGTDIAAGR